MYQDYYFEKTDLEKLISGKIKPEDISRIIGAYEMAETSQSGLTDTNGLPKFYHTSRLPKILIQELEIYEPDLIISALLHNLLIHCKELTISLVDYNFGSSVAYYVQLLTDDYLILTRQKAEELDLTFIDDEALILILTDCLDVIRTYDFMTFLNPFAYLDDIKKRYFMIAKKRDNEKIHYLLKEIRKVFNELIG